MTDQGARAGAPPEVDPGPSENLYDLAVRRAATYPDAAEFGGRDELGWKTLTSVQFLGLVDRLAGMLAAEGVRPGDRVVLRIPLHWQTPAYFFAIWRLGASVVPFDREMNPGAAFHTGVAHLAAALDATGVPFGVAGSEKVLVRRPRGATWLSVGGASFSIVRGPPGPLLC